MSWTIGPHAASLDPQPGAMVAKRTAAANNEVRRGMFQSLARRVSVAPSRATPADQGTWDLSVSTVGNPKLPPVSRKRIERQLAGVAEELRALRAEAAIGAEQLSQVAAEADDARLRALVADSPLARHEDGDARRSADTLAKHHSRVVAKVAELEARQDELLDELTALRA